MIFSSGHPVRQLLLALKLPNEKKFNCLVIPNFVKNDRCVHYTTLLTYSCAQLDA